MRIFQLSLEGRGAWPDLHVDSLNSQLNVFFGAPRAGKSTIARLASHLLYGKTESLWRKQFGQTVPLTEGTISLECEQGNYVLRRHRDTSNQEKLTIASADGNLVDSQTMRSLLANLSPELTSRLFAVDFAESPPVEWLLSDEFSRQFTATHHATEQKPACCNNENTSQFASSVDRRRIDELVSRRDTVAQEIEQQLAVRRQESGVLVREVNEVDADLAAKRERKEELSDQLRGIEKELAEIEVRLRYFSLETVTQSTQGANDSEQHQQQLDELEAEISRCRQALGDLNAREAVVRNELAQLTADGTADSVTCFTDGRTTLNVMERLLDDLDAEVAQIARANEPGRCISLDTHARISPVAEMLRMQVYTLCGQLTEQERIARRQQVMVESRQLARAQTDLGERLEQLLGRRESLIQKNRLIGQPVVLVPQSPADKHCSCDRHGQFVTSAEAMQLGSRNRQKIESDVHQRRVSLEQLRARTAEELKDLQGEIEQLELRWKQLQGERAGLIGSASLEENKFELERLETLISQALREQSVQEPPITASGNWRASDVLAQLTDGQLVQIHLNRQGQQTTVVDRDGRALTIEVLSPAQHDAVYLSLTLALVSSYANSGVKLPLILDEPFLRQDASHAAAMAGVLEEFARAGHQLFVFTEDYHARRRFESIGTSLFDLEAIRSRPATKPVQAAAEPTQTVTSTNTRIVRQSLGCNAGPSLRLAPTDGESDDQFYLSSTSSFDEFPILGEHTAQLFATINIKKIDDLLAADATEVAARLDRREIGPEAVQLWQIHMGLMCFVPEVTLNDAQLLSAAGIISLEDLLNFDADELLRSLEEFLSSERAHHFAPTRNRYSRSRLQDWILGAKRYQDRWNRTRSRYPWPQKLSTKQRTSQRQQASRRNRTSSQASSTNPQSATPREHRFYLEMNSDVEAAPSIGPKTATRLTKVGIRTVADLLNADPESTAEELGVSHIKPKTISDWQHQSRLVCRIPLLRGIGAQLLVACGFTEPEQINSTGFKEVADRIVAFCDTKKGQRILRNGDSPSRGDIIGWVESTAHTRPLEAA